ncbi:MAG: GFA family protein [Pseudomonadales bacterium]|nr:GFA family protein [Pseudomonadales bacterium]
MAIINPTHTASCHCGAVVLELDLPNGLRELGRCNCSMCRRRGAIFTFVALENLRVTKGENKLSLYQFNTKAAKHYFCSVCGIYTHHQRRSNPNQFAVNVGCMEDVNPYELGEVLMFDGMNHSSDKG